MGSHLVDGGLPGALAHDPPDDLFANTRAPNGTAMCHTAEYQTFFDTSNRQPFIHCSLYPVGHWNRADMTTLTEQVNDGPVIISLLKVRQLQTDQLGTPEATAQQEGQDGMISLPFVSRLSGASRSLRP